MDLPDPPVLVISDRSQAPRPLLDIAEAAFAGGCRWFSLREKDLPPAERGELLAALVRLGHRFGATVMAHEDIETVAKPPAPAAFICQPAAIRERHACGCPAR